MTSQASGDTRDVARKALLDRTRDIRDEIDAWNEAHRLKPPALTELVYLSNLVHTLGSLFERLKDEDGSGIHCCDEDC